MNAGPVSKGALPELEKLVLDEEPFPREKALLALKSLQSDRPEEAGC